MANRYWDDYTMPAVPIGSTWRAPSGAVGVVFATERSRGSGAVRRVVRIRYASGIARPWLHDEFVARFERLADAGSPLSVQDRNVSQKASER